MPQTSSMNSLQKKQLKDFIRGALVSGILTSIFMYFIYFKGIQSIWAGLFIGFSIYMVMIAYNIKFADRYLRKTNLLLLLLINTFVNLLVMVVIAWVGVGIFYMEGNFELMVQSIRNVLGYYYAIGLLFGFFLGIFFNFFSIVDTLIGKAILAKLFIGKYRNPFEVKRVFMFLDIKSSTTIAEKIGHKNFLSFVNDFFYDIAIPVSQTKGEIYKYVGDEAIITWKLKDALKEGNCIRCFMGIQNQIDKKKEYYLNRYGLIPEFKAGMHGGTVITGELGYTRREIAFMGDVLNTTARIEEACKTYQTDFLVSEELMNQVNIPENLTSRKVGNVILRGKSAEVGLMSIEKAA